MARMGSRGDSFTTEPATPKAWGTEPATPQAWLAKPKAWGTERKTEEEGLGEIARRYLLQPVGGFPPT